MASVLSNYANEILKQKQEILESMSSDDLIALAKGILTIASRKPGAPDLSTAQTDLTSASATVAA